jgi:hypothetical protein
MKAQKGISGTILLLLLPRLLKGWVVNITLRPLYPLEWSGTHCIGSGAGRSVGMNWCRQFTGIWPRTVQAIASRYTDWAIPAHTGRK